MRAAENMLANRQRPDYILLFILMALLSIGFIMVFSASPTLGMKIGDSLYYLRRHAIHLSFGALALVAGLKFDYRNLKGWSGPAMIGIIALLTLIFIPGLGRSAGGAVRWMDASFIAFQPSEIAKFIVVLYLASLFSSWDYSKASVPRLIFMSVAPIILIAYLIMKQPDLGTTLVIAGTAVVMFYIAGMKERYLILSAAAGAAALIVMSFTSEYRFRRIMAFIDPWKAPLDIGFHIIQSLLAIGSGGLLGLGLGGSKQKFFYLPQHYTDFIYSILSEELGFLGAAGVIILFVLFVTRGFRIARLAADEFGRLLAGGIISWIAIQALLNLYVVTGMFPVTGIPLPFISFGGTALVVTMYAVGVLLNISRAIVVTGKEGVKQ